MSEQQLQTKIINWLKKKGCYVIKAQAGPGVPVGCPDIIALFDGGGWVAIEVKATEKARFQPLQLQTVKKLNGMYFSRVVYPDNWKEVQKELADML